MARFMEDVDDLKPSTPLEPPTPTLPTVSPAIPSQQSTGSAAVAPVLAPTPVVAPPVNDLSISDITARMGVAIDSLDDLDDPKIGRTDRLDLVRPVSGNSVRVALLTRYLPAKVAYVHYVKGHGLLRCLSPDDKAGLCCIMLKDSQPEFVALVLSYTNANLETGRYDKEYATGQYPTIRWTIGYVRLSMCGYRQLSQIVKEKGHHLDDIDIVISPRDDSLRYDYRKISLARWKRYPELVKRVEAAIQPFVADGGKRLRRRGRWCVHSCRYCSPLEISLAH